MPFDIHIEGLPISRVHGSRGIGFGDYALHIGVMGPQKMVDRFMKCFLTPIGSDLTDKEYGTPVASALGNSIGSTTLAQLVHMSAQQVVTTLQRYDSLYDTPDDERLVLASIEQLEVTAAGDGFDAYVRLQNAAGTTVLIMVSDIFVRNP
jgi:hypothetical protein